MSSAVSKLSTQRDLRADVAKPFAVVGRRVVGVGVVLLGIGLEGAIIIVGPDFGYEDLIQVAVVLGWLTLSPEAALGALGLVAGGIFGISLTAPASAARVSAVELSNHRGRLFILDLFSFSAVLIAWMVVFRLLTATDRVLLRDSFGLAVIVVLGSLTTAAVARMRVRHEDLEREMAEQDAQRVELRSRRVAQFWDRVWPDDIPDAHLRLGQKYWRHAGTGCLMIIAVFGAADLLTVLLVAGRSPVASIQFLASLAVQLIYFFLVPVAGLAYLVNKLRTTPYWSERVFACGAVVLGAILILSLAVALFLVLPIAATFAYVVLPLLAAASISAGFLRRRGRRSPIWMPWRFSRQFMADFAAQREGVRRARSERLAARIRSGVIC